jgi:hypothetical protein
MASTMAAKNSRIFTFSSSVKKLMNVFPKQPEGFDPDQDPGQDQKQGDESTAQWNQKDHFRLFA